MNLVCLIHRHDFRIVDDPLIPIKCRRCGADFGMYLAKIWGAEIKEPKMYLKEGYMPKKKEPELSVVSSCPDCGAPIYGPKTRTKDEKLGLEYSCSCNCIRGATPGDTRKTFETFREIFEERQEKLEREAAKKTAEKIVARESKKELGTLPRVPEEVTRQKEPETKKGKQVPKNLDECTRLSCEDCIYYHSPFLSDKPEDCKAVSVLSAKELKSVLNIPDMTCNELQEIKLDWRDEE